MPASKRMKLYTVMGSYLVHLLKYNDEVKTTGHSLGWMLAATYEIPLSKNIGISTEAQWLKAIRTKDRSLSLQVNLSRHLLRWKSFSLG
jgi:hypothetical protein